MELKTPHLADMAQCKMCAVHDTREKSWWAPKIAMISEAADG